MLDENLPDRPTPLRDEQGRWLKGECGNLTKQKRGPSKTSFIRNWCLENVDEILEKMQEMLYSPVTPPTIKWDIIKTCWFMMEGKPKESKGPDEKELKEISQMSGDELASELFLVNEFLENRKGEIIDGEIIEKKQT